MTLTALDLTGVACPMNWVRTQAGARAARARRRARACVLDPGEPLDQRAALRARGRATRSPSTGDVVTIVKRMTLSDAELERYSRQLVLPGVERRGPGAAEGGDAIVVGRRARSGRRRPPTSRPPGVGHDRRRRRGRRRALEPAPPAAALHARRRAASKAENAALKLGAAQPGGRGRALPGAARRAERRGDRHGRRRGGRLLRLVRDPLRWSTTPAARSGVPLVEAGVLGFDGLVLSIRPGESACYRCAFPAEPPRRARVPSCREAGVLGRDGGHRRVDPGARGAQAADRGGGAADSTGSCRSTAATMDADAGRHRAAATTARRAPRAGCATIQA